MQCREEVEETTVVELVAATWALVATIASVAASGRGATTSRRWRQRRVAEDCGTSCGSVDDDGRGRGDPGGMYSVGDSGCVSDGNEDNTDISGDSFVDGKGGTER
jgi:hypothetical protein